MKKSIIYVQTTENEYNDPNHFLGAQKRLLWKFAYDNQMSIVAEFEDIGARITDKRIKFHKMLKYINRHNVKYIIVEKTDRLYSGFKDFIALDQLIQRLNLTIFLVEECESIGKDSVEYEHLVNKIKIHQAQNYLKTLQEEIINT